MFMHEMATAQACFGDSDFVQAFRHFERAHILGQRYFWPHMISHWWMFRVGLKRSDTREIAGQLVRMMAVVPGYIFGWVPKGNTGGADVSPIKPMPIPDDLAEFLADYKVMQDVAGRLVIIVAVLATTFFLNL